MGDVARVTVAVRDEAGPRPWLDADRDASSHVTRVSHVAQWRALSILGLCKNDVCCDNCGLFSK